MLIYLPWPPSINKYWRHARGGHFISEGGKKYRAKACAMMRGLSIPFARVAVTVYAAPPDNRTRDLDNILKAPLDAITHAHAWPDDGIVDSLAVVRCKARPGGAMVLYLARAAEPYDIETFIPSSQPAAEGTNQ